MRKIIALAAMLLLMASLFGCTMIDKVMNNDDASLGDKVEGEKIDYDGAVMEYVSHTADSLTVKIANGTDSTWQSGNMRDYSLEAERDGEWYAVNQIGEMANTMELMIFAPGQTLTHTFSFGERYGKLSAGKYRVVKSYWANATETSEAGEFHLVCEFTIE